MAGYPFVGFYFEVKILPSLNSTADSLSSLLGGRAGLMDNLGTVSNVVGAVATAAVDASFQEVTGLSLEIQTEDITEGGENRFSYKVPQACKYQNLVLKRGMASSSSPLSSWCESTFDHGLSVPIEKRNIVVSLLSPESKTPAMVWTIEGAYPLKWQVSALNAMNNELAIETLEMAYERFYKVGIGDMAGAGLNAIGSISGVNAFKKAGSIIAKF